MSCNIWIYAVCKFNDSQTSYLGKGLKCKLKKKKKIGKCLLYIGQFTLKVLLWDLRFWPFKTSELKAPGGLYDGKALLSACLQFQMSSLMKPLG